MAGEGLHHLTMASMVRIFADKLEDDARHPVFQFTVPAPDGDHYEFGLMGIIPEFWLQLFAFGVFHCVFGALAATLAYYFILHQKRSVTALLVAYGIICPLVLYLPYQLVYVLDLRNPVLKLTAVSSPALLIFRCLETLYDTLPLFATSSYTTFIWYFATTVEFDVNSKTQERFPTTRQDVQRKMWQLFVLFLQGAALFTILIPCDYHLFPRGTSTGENHRHHSSEVGTDDDLHMMMMRTTSATATSTTMATFTEMFYWGNLANSYFMGALTKTLFEFGMSLLGLIVSIGSGYNTCSINVRPLTATNSPSDFWGRRWNILVSSGLKRAIYKPVRTVAQCPTAVAAFITFMASGLLHEYFLTAMAFNGGNKLQFLQHQDQEQHWNGYHLFFFLWNAVVLIMERLLKGNPLIRFLKQSLPKPVRTLLVFMTVLPIAHVFFDQFVAIGFYSGFSLGYPRIVVTKISDHGANYSI